MRKSAGSRGLDTLLGFVIKAPKMEKDSEPAHILARLELPTRPPRRIVWVSGVSPGHPAVSISENGTTPLKIMLPIEGLTQYAPTNPAGFLTLLLVSLPTVNSNHL